MKSYLKKLFKDKIKNKIDNSDSKALKIVSSPFFKYIASSLSGCLISFILFIALIAVVFAPIMMAQEYLNKLQIGVSEFFEKVGNFFTLKGWCTDAQCDSSFDEKYYAKLDEVYQQYKNNGVEINVDLITGTIYYNSSLNTDSDKDDSYISDVSVLASKMVSGSTLDYSMYRSYLVSSYIPKRFSNLYSDDLGKERIADEIMAYANYSSRNIASNNFSSFSGGCSSVTIKTSSSIEVLDLEDYVAGVVTAENGGAGLEARKMQAIAARTNAVRKCNEVIDTTANFQAYKQPTEAGIEAAQATNGLVLTYQGNLLEDIAFASYPMPFYNSPTGFPGYYAKGAVCSDVVCSDKEDGRRWCQTTIYKLPDLEGFTLDMPETSTSGNYWNGLSLTNQKGHCYGVSQVATIYYEKELNYDYKKMIETFFSDGVEVSSLSTMLGFSGDVGSTDGTTFLPYELSRFLSEKGTSVDAFNQSIKQAVIAAGPGTRAGVVASVNALVNGLSQYGVKLPYISSISSDGSLGKYKGYGVDPVWGTKGTWYSGVYHRNYYQKGLDCSGLVSWAIHNGGYKYLGYNSGGFLDNIGVSHSFASFRGQPGDIVVKYGHVGIIIGVTDSEYLVAEEHGGENGLEITHYTFSNLRNQFTHILDMNGYYSNSSNMDLSYYQGG